MKIFIPCEYSGRVRDAFIARGHDAISCDLLPTESPGPHIQGDARPWLKERWDMVIAFPPCTYLCNSGVRWLADPSRWPLMEEAARFFLECLNANAPMVAVENPVMHGYGQRIIGKGPSFTIQPWQFGHGEVKRTCFWTVGGLPPLYPTKVVVGRLPRIHSIGPSVDRWRERSRTLLGVASAMADQWGIIRQLGSENAQLGGGPFANLNNC